MEITAIEPRRKGRSALFLDGEYAVSVDTETLIKSGYRAGQELTDEELYELLQRSEQRQANERALYLLEHRSHAKGELMEKLRRTVSPEAAEAAADRMEELGLIDDEDYARRYAGELFRRKGYSQRRVILELTRKGIDKDLAEELAEEMSPDPEEKILAVLEKKYPNCLEDEKTKRRAVAALQRLGYGWEEIKDAMAAFGEQQDCF